MITLRSNLLLMALVLALGLALPRPCDAFLLAEAGTGDSLAAWTLLAAGTKLVWDGLAG